MTKRTLIALAILFAAPAQAEVYKCTDANGRTVYTQSTCGEKLVIRTHQPSELEVLENDLRILDSQLSGARARLRTYSTAPAQRPLLDRVPIGMRVFFKYGL